MSFKNHKRISELNKNRHIRLLLWTIMQFYNVIYYSKTYTQERNLLIIELVMIPYVKYCNNFFPCPRNVFAIITN